MHPLKIFTKLLGILIWYKILRAKNKINTPTSGEHNWLSEIAADIIQFGKMYVKGAYYDF